MKYIQNLCLSVIITFSALPSLAGPPVDTTKKIIASKTLLEASKNGDHALVKTLVSTANIAINTTNENGVTALMFAAYKGHEAISDLLLKYGANPNLTTQLNKDFNFGKFLSHTNKKSTALMLACSVGCLQIVRALLNTGIDVNAQDSDGQTALIYTILSDKNWPDCPLNEARKKIIQVLLDFNANPYITDHYDQDAVYYYSLVAGLVKSYGTSYDTDQAYLEKDALYKRMTQGV